MKIWHSDGIAAPHVPNEAAAPEKHGSQRFRTRSCRCLVLPSPPLFLLCFMWSCIKTGSSLTLRAPPGSQDHLSGSVCWENVLLPLPWVRSYPLQRFDKMGQLNFAHTPTLPKNWCPLVSGMFFPQPDATTVSNMSPSIPETCLLSTEPNRNSNCRSFVELCGDGGTGTTLWMCKPPLNCSLHNG